MGRTTGRAVALLLLMVAAVPDARGQRPGQLPGEKYALLVGVRKYGRSSELRELQYTERDMDELAGVLRAGGYRPENVMLMTQAAGAENTRALPIAVNIRRELKALLRDRIEADGVVVAFAGHGIQYRGSDETYFCPADARPDDRSTLVSLKEVYAALEACPARFKLLLSDACRNDPISAVSRRATVALDSVTRPQLQRPPGGVAALFSCSEGELAFENDALKHGVFFHFVIEGLRGAADFDGDGQVALEELTFFAKRRVLDFVRAEYDGVRQMPVLKGEVGGLPVLVRLDRPRLPQPAPPPTARPSEGKTITNSIGMKLTLIPAGEFLMGSSDSDKEADDNEKPQHRVRIARPFYLGVTEVTQGQYRAVTGQSPSWRKNSDELPVESVSWLDAVNFCNALSRLEGLKPYYQFGAGSRSGGEGYRLPTEAEWEYACRGGSPARYSFGNDAASLGEYAWFQGGGTEPVGQKRPNAFGLFDMHGNVAEWCWDEFDSKYYAQSAVDDPRGPSGASGRVNRGGAFNDTRRDLRSAQRRGYGDRDASLGFRLVRGQSGG